MFVDGVYAVAATLLVLDLWLPEHVPPGQLGHELAELGPVYVAYAMGFLQMVSEAVRDRGYGLPASEYHALYALRDKVRPSPASRFWVGWYEGVRGWSVRVTPLAVRVNGLPEPDRPQGYAMTIVLDGVTQTLRVRTTQMWVRIDGRWLCLAGHAGPLVP